MARIVQVLDSTIYVGTLSKSIGSSVLALEGWHLDDFSDDELHLSILVVFVILDVSEVHKAIVHLKQLNEGVLLCMGDINVASSPLIAEDLVT